MIEREQVAKVAQLARLDLDEAELEALSIDLQRITRFVDRLEEVDVSGVEALSHAGSARDVTRPDEPREPLSHEAVMSNAPDQARGLFRVPKVLDGGEG